MHVLNSATITSLDSRSTFFGLSERVCTHISSNRIEYGTEVCCS